MVELLYRSTSNGHECWPTGYRLKYRDTLYHCFLLVVVQIEAYYDFLGSTGMTDMSFRHENIWEY
jgi:hypothetical protein